MTADRNDFDLLAKELQVSVPAAGRAAGLDKFPTDEELLAVARTVLRQYC